MLSVSSIVVANSPWSKADPALKDAALTKADVIVQLLNEHNEHRTALIAGTVFVAYLCYVFLRKPLLENRRLRFMAGFSPYGGSFRAYGVCSIFVIAFGIWLYVSSVVADEAGIITPAGYIVHLTVALFAVCLSTMITHVFEYSRVSRMFASLEALSLPRAIRSTTEAQRERLRLLETHQFLNGYDPNGTDLDFLPDREQSLTAMTAMAKRLGEQLKDLTERESDDLIFAECDGYVKVTEWHVDKASGKKFDGEENPEFKPKLVMITKDRISDQAIKLSHPRREGLAERLAEFEVREDIPKEAADKERPVTVVARADFRPNQRVSAGDILVRITRTNHSDELRDVGMSDLIKSYGSVAALFHPDYLPHLSHTYLKLSQMRALNMPPRRIQLLGRQWSLRGLESEYVVVHDVSDIRSDYRERQVDENSKARRDEAAPAAATVHAETESASGTAAVKKSDAVIDKNSYESSEQHKTKWRSRPLKKRARVVVAPDGSLIRIAIEEERQFNI